MDFMKSSKKVFLARIVYHKANTSNLFVNKPNSVDYLKLTSLVIMAEGAANEVEHKSKFKIFVTTI